MGVTAPVTTVPHMPVSPVRLLSDALAWVDAIAERVLTTLESEGFEPTAETRAGVPALVQRVVEAVLHLARQRAAPLTEGYEDLADTCRRHRLSRHLAVRAVQLAADDAWHALVASATGDERRHLLDTVDRLGRLIEALRQVVLLEYAGDRLTPVDTASAERVISPPHRTGTGCHAIVALAGRQPPEIEQLRARLGSRGLIMEIDEVTVALLPGSGSSSPSRDGLLAAARAQIDRLDLKVSAGLAFRPPGGRMSEAVAEAREILWTVLELDYEPRAYQMEDVVLEILLLRSPDVARKMAQHLLPLKAAYPELLDTLEEVLEATGKRDATARKLCIHPNTLAYRLRKISELTSLSVTQRPRDQWLARVALTSMNTIGRSASPQV